MASVIPSAPLGTEAASGPHGPGAATGAAPCGPAAERRFRFELAAHPGSPAQARRLTRARLTGWSVCEDTCDTAALVVSELVTNAIVHTASSRIVCELSDRADLVRIAVRDEGCAPGQPQPSSRRQPEDEHGRGLLLVDALCHAWGAQEHGPGLLVWAELPHTADAPPEPSVTSAPSEAPEPSGTPGHPVAPEPRGDLGWGTRPKPGPPTPPGAGSGDDEGGGDTADRTHDARQHGTDRHEPDRHEPDRHEADRHGTARHGTARHGTARHGTGGERL
ncbi:ATP-binding protein [Streptomyces sp. NPDC090994]|uniref:ATP-binding protein n=1 Tax=Streptomyces sp. NPDC090994 TaxID=3365969 RepID=UPI0038169200